MEEEDSSPATHRIDAATVLRASNALLVHLRKSAPKGGLVDEIVNISMSLHLSRMPGRYIAKPVQIALPNTLLDPEDGIEICVISKDPTDELKAKLMEVPVAGVTKVLAVGKLKKNYHEFQKRRELVNAYDAFFCDDRVVTMMPKLCGKVFFDRKKLPVPVRVSGSAAAVAKEISKARDSTFMVVGQGQTISIRIGKSNMTADQVAENVLAAINPAVDAVPKKWRSITSVYLQATGTVALPIYKDLPDVQVDVDEDDEDEDDQNEDEDDEDEEDEEVKPTIKGKKKNEAVGAGAGTASKAPVKAGAKATTTTTATTTAVKAISKASEDAATNGGAGKKRSRVETVEATKPSTAAAATTTTNKETSNADKKAKKTVSKEVVVEAPKAKAAVVTAIASEGAAAGKKKAAPALAPAPAPAPVATKGKGKK